MRLYHLAIRAPLAWVAGAALFALLLAGACGGGSSNPSPLTISPSPVVSVPAVSGDSAVYLSLGDSVGQGCCGAFAGYLGQTLGRDVQMVNLAADGSSVDLVAGANHVRPSQLDTALAAIQQYESSGHSVVAITLVTGRTDFEQQVASCGDATDACQQAFQSQFLGPYSERLAFILRQLNSVAPSASVFLLNYFDPASCPGASASSFTLADVNGAIAQVASSEGGSLVDVSKTDGGCESLTGPTPAPGGIDAIETGLEAAYGALPPPPPATG